MPEMQMGLVAECPQCHFALWRKQTYAFKYIIACSLAAMLFYCFAIMAPFLEITAYGRFQLAKIETGPNHLMLSGFQLVGFLVLAVTVIFPGVKICLLLVTLIGLETKTLPGRFLKAIFRWYEPIRPWAMIDVYLLGFMVAYTRLIAMATVHLDTALFALIGVMFAMAAADAALDRESVWQALDEVDKDTTRHAAERPSKAARAGTPQLIGCECCDFVNNTYPGEKCARCGATLHKRKAGSIGSSAAFLIAAAVLYVPANIYPVMTITTLGSVVPYTIMGGIVELIDANLWPLAILVFVASISIPLLKLLILAYMLWQTKYNKAEHLLGRTRAYRIIKFVGRWSMIDVFMISILVALVRFGQFTNVAAQIGAACFAAVVVLTMLAVDLFDPRLMWDKQTTDAVFRNHKAESKNPIETGLEST